MTGTVFAIVKPLRITTTSLPDGTLGKPYRSSSMPPAAYSPYTWNKYGPKGRGVLPYRVRLSSSGLISGAPERVGTYTIVVKCLNSIHPYKAKATQQLTLTINP